MLSWGEWEGGGEMEWEGEGRKSGGECGGGLQRHTIKGWSLLGAVPDWKSRHYVSEVGASRMAQTVPLLGGERGKGLWVVVEEVWGLVEEGEGVGGGGGGGGHYGSGLHFRELRVSHSSPHLQVPCLFGL